MEYEGQSNAKIVFKGVTTRGGVRGSRGGAMGSKGGTRGKRGGAVGNKGGAVGNKGGKGSKRGGTNSGKTSGGVQDGGMAQVESGGVVEEEEDPPQTETQDGAEEIIHETQPKSEKEEEEGINDTQELPVHLRIMKRRRPSERIVKTKLNKMGCVGTSTNSTLELD
ncbi:unnamed protein product [Lactuca saligna]|uniref:Uncharacterized protein n=1 Tax=Lactuca saligna TaxID=75948 RepID=A0AA35V8C7_LACSI|nr:unnamed protein product [Lactuca saligna]